VGDAIVVFVDRLSKRVHYVPTVTKVSALDFLLIFVNTILRSAYKIISDEILLCCSGSMSLPAFSIQRCMSTAFRRSDGPDERANRTRNTGPAYQAHDTRTRLAAVRADAQDGYPP
jgi:pyruvate/oxaloacetate carboxyltransferase